MLKIIQHFGKQCSNCHLLSESVMAGHFLQPYTGHAERGRVGFDGADCWSGRADCYPIGDEHVAEEKK
jgi:hypothetical protein